MKEHIEVTPLNRRLATPVILLALSAALCAQSQPPAQNTTNTTGAIQSTATFPAKRASEPVPIYLPSGLDIQIRMNEALSSATSQAGDTFSGTLINSIDDDNNNILFERGSSVTGRVISAKPSGRLQDSGELVLTLDSIHSQKLAANVTTISKTITGESHTGSNTKKVGGGAILGAIIGGIAGGGKGAAIGAGAGAAAGTGAAAATGKKEAKVDPESLVRFVTTTETTVLPLGSPALHGRQPLGGYANDSGPRDENAPVLQRRRDSNQNGTPSQTQDQNGYPSQTQSSSRPSATVARNGGDTGGPVLQRRPGSDSDVTGTSSNTNNNTQTTANTSANTVPTNNTATNNNTTSNSNTVSNNSTVSNTSTGTNTGSNTATSTTTQWTFNARDKRVITSCLAENPGSVPAADANAIPYYKGDTLPYAAQKKIRALPLACERQLPAVGNDQERIIYNQQVLLISGNNLVLDSFDIPKQ